MEGHCSTGQSPQWAVVPMEEGEGERGGGEEGGGKKKKRRKRNSISSSSSIIFVTAMSKSKYFFTNFRLGCLSLMIERCGLS